MTKKFLTLMMATFFVTSPALANPKPWPLSWGWGHFANTDFSQPYMENAQDSHNRQWDHEKWSPDVWIQQSQGGDKLIEGFYRAGILVDQKVKNSIPYLYVGPNFYKLSGYDQRRVIQSVDDVYHITNVETDDLFYVYDDCKDRVIGIYTRNGLQFQ